MIIPWVLWFAAAYLSQLSFSTPLLIITQGVLGIVGLIAPVGVASYLFWRDPQLRIDLKQRLFHPKKWNHTYTFFALYFLFGSIIIAQLISIPL